MYCDPMSFLLDILIAIPYTVLSWILWIIRTRNQRIPFLWTLLNQINRLRYVVDFEHCLELLVSVSPRQMKSPLTCQNLQQWIVDQFMYFCDCLQNSILNEWIHYGIMAAYDVHDVTLGWWHRIRCDVTMGLWQRMMCEGTMERWHHVMCEITMERWHHMMCEVTMGWWHRMKCNVTMGLWYRMMHHFGIVVL